MDPPLLPGGSISTTAPPPPPLSTNINEKLPSAATNGSEKLRLMCSYGGYIYPRPHDKCLSYIGGDTRIFVTERNISLTELSTKLSKTFLNGKPFCLKYQLQNEDLDSLVSVTSDEDLENMIDEYDRININNKSKVCRLRLFLFPVKESLMKSEDWFLNVLNGTTASSKVFSESSSVNCLLSLDDDVANVNVKKGSSSIQDVQSVSDSPMVETTSSFGSASSMVNLPRIKVHVEENQKGGIEEQFSQMTVGVAPAAVVSSMPVVGGGSLQQQLQLKPAIPSDLPSPDSVSSEGSVTNPLSRRRHYFYQEPGVQIQSGSGRLSSNSSVDLKLSDSSGRSLPVQHDQHPQMLQPQQYVHYIHQTPSGPVPMAPYFHPIYPSQHQTHPQHPGLEHQQYPVYFAPTGPTQGYGLPLQQTNITEPAQTVPSSRPQTSLHPTMATSVAAYNPARNPPASKPEMVAGTYRTSAAAPPQFVQITSGQHQQQYAAYSLIQHPSQSIPTTSATTANYAYDFADPTHAKMYYSQPLAHQLASQYQIMTSAPAGSFQETSSQLPVENMKQQIRTLHP